MRVPRLILVSLGLLLLGSGGWGRAEALEEWAECVLVPWEYNDGDSFLIRTPEGAEHRVRLYYVDAPETAVDDRSDQRRVREQTAHFGLASAADTIQAGLEAAAFTTAQLEEPFTVHTAEARALGRGREPRIYAFVRTAAGRDLGELLIASGLARAFGVGRMTPEGVHRDEFFERLRDLELAAALRRIGIWEKSDPEALVERRAALRKELAELDALRREVIGPDEETHLVNPNTASAEALQSLPGIGPALSARIIEHRPYESADDLLRVSGIGPALLDAIRDRLVFSD